MKSKTFAIWLCVTVSLLAALFALSLSAGRAGYRNLLLVSPLTYGAAGHTPEKLDEFSGEEFLLTYEIRRSATVQSGNERHTVGAIGTNACYASILGYTPLSGGFFTDAAMDAKNRHVALNEAAAFQIFGSTHIAGQALTLDGETWIVSGVVQDADEDNANLYVPAGITGGQADSVMVLLDDRVTEAYAKNALKSIGIRDSDDRFLNLSKSADAFHERFTVARGAALFAFALCLTVHIGAALANRLRFFRAKLREIYTAELFSRCRADIFKSIAMTILFAAAIVAMLILSLQILETCLTWQELTPISGKLTAGDFGHKLIWLHNYELVNTLLFAGCILSSVVCSALWLYRRKTEFQACRSGQNTPHPL